MGVKKNAKWGVGAYTKHQAAASTRKQACVELGNNSNYLRLRASLAPSSANLPLHPPPPSFPPYLCIGHSHDHLGPIFGDAARLGFAPHHEACGEETGAVGAGKKEGKP